MDGFINFIIWLGKASHAWIDHFWVKILVFLAFWVIFYLPISSILYVQATMWLKGNANKWIVLMTSILAAGMSTIVCILINGFAVWWTSPMNVYYLPLSGVDSGYVNLWVPFIILAGIVGGAIWYELHRIRINTQ
jgi:hypothetical protein